MPWIRIFAYGLLIALAVVLVLLVWERKDPDDGKAERDMMDLFP